MAETGGQYELYRRSSIGMALTDALDSLVQEGHVDPVLAMKVLKQFDASIAEALHHRVRARATLRSRLHFYRSCDDVWTFILQNPMLRFENEEVTADRVKLVAC
ncbi:transcription initiation factor IIA, gamma subunit, partial [Caulochytrium protostelioides]